MLLTIVVLHVNYLAQYELQLEIHFSFTYTINHYKLLWSMQF